VKTCECQVVNADDANYCSSCGRRLPETVVVDTAASPAVAVDPAAAAQQRRRILRIVASFVVGALVVAVGLTIGLRNVHIDIGSTQPVSVRLPLNVCPTSVGSASDTPADLPSTLRVRLAPGYSNKLAVYADNEGVIEVLAPKGWTCTAQIAGDGSSGVQVSPPGQTSISSATLSAGSTDEVINECVRRLPRVVGVPVVRQRRDRVPQHLPTRLSGAPATGRSRHRRQRTRRGVHRPAGGQGRRGPVRRRVSRPGRDDLSRQHVKRRKLDGDVRASIDALVDVQGDRGELRCEVRHALRHGSPGRYSRITAGAL
jgi:hypothetical protein